MRRKYIFLVLIFVVITSIIYSQEANEYNERGVMLYLERKYKEALAQFIKALNIKPDDADIHYNTALCYEALNNIEKAIHHYKRTLELSPYNLDAYNNLGVIYYKKGDYTKAEELWKKVLEIDSRYTRAKENLEVLKRLRKKPPEKPPVKEVKEREPERKKIEKKEKEKVEKKEIVIKKEPSVLIAEAIGYLEAAKSLQPNDFNTHYNLAVAYLQKDDLDNAIKNFEKAAAIKEDFLVYFNLAVCYFKKDDYKSALEYFQKTININKDDYRSHSYLGLTFLKINRVDTAIEYFKRAVKINEDDLLSYRLLALTYLKMDDYENAKSVLNEIIERENDYIAFNNLGCIYAKENKIEKAIPCFTKAIKLNKKFILPYYNLSIIYLNLCDYHQAIATMKKMYELDKRNADICFLLAYTYEKLNNDDEAIKYYKETLHINPHFIKAKNRLATLLLKKTLAGKQYELKEEELKFELKFELSMKEIEMMFR